MRLHLRCFEAFSFALTPGNTRRISFIKLMGIRKGPRKKGLAVQMRRKCMRSKISRFKRRRIFLGKTDLDLAAVISKRLGQTRSAKCIRAMEACEYLSRYVTLHHPRVFDASL